MQRVSLGLTYRFFLTCHQGSYLIRPLISKFHLRIILSLGHGVNAIGSRFEKMSTNHYRRLLFVLTLGFVVSCSQRPELAKTASLAQFDGNWTGEWSWAQGGVADLEIKLGRIKYTNFPAFHAKGETIVSGESEVEFQNQWSTPAPCILMTLPDSGLVVPIYITKDKNRLYYPVSTSKRKYIVFSRKGVAH